MIDKMSQGFSCVECDTKRRRARISHEKLHELQYENKLFLLFATSSFHSNCNIFIVEQEKLDPANGLLCKQYMITTHKTRERKTNLCLTFLIENVPFASRLKGAKL